MLHGVTVRSDVARGRILDIEFDPAIPWDEFTIVTAADIPGKNRVALILDDQPYLADDLINHPEEPVVLLAHRDRHHGRRSPAARARPRGAAAGRLLDRRGAGGARKSSGAPTTSSSRYLVSRGDVDAAFAGAAIVVEGEYETGAQEQLYIEPNGMLAIASPEDGVTVWGSMQCPYYVHNALAPLFGIPADKIRVVQMETGGGFGGKEEYPTVIAGHAALLAWKSGRPGEDDLRPRRGHGRDHQAASVADAASHGDRRRRTPARDGHRLRDRRRRLLHAVAGRPVARDDPRRRTLLLPERPRPRPRRRDQRAPARRVPRLRRAAEPLRAGAPHGSRRGGGRPDAGGIPPPQFHRARRRRARSAR